EFVNGAGEALRALLLVGVAGSDQSQPEGLTEGLKSVVHEYAPQLPPADIVRLLTILSESEERLSRSANQRLLVEVLLLRWAMLDRTVELSEVIEALREGKGDAGRGTGSGAQPAAPSRPTPTPVPLPPPPAPGKKLEPTLENVRSVWPQVVQDTRAKTPLLGSLLADVDVTAVEERVVTIRPGNAAHAEAVERQGDTVAQALGMYISEARRVKFVGGAGGGGAGGGGGGGGGASGGTAAGERLTPERAAAERLKSLRAKDPTLSAAVDA